MLLHTDTATGVLSVFPGLDKTWPDAAFHLLRADGAAAVSLPVRFLVSAQREGGTTRFIRIESHSVVGESGDENQNQSGEGEAGTVPVMFAVPRDSAWADPAHPPSTIPADAMLTWRGAGVWSTTIATNGAMIVYAAGVAPPFVIKPLQSNATEEQWFGYNWPAHPLQLDGASSATLSLITNQVVEHHRHKCFNRMPRYDLRRRRYYPKALCKDVLIHSTKRSTTSLKYNKNGSN